MGVGGERETGIQRGERERKARGVNGRDGRGDLRPSL